MNQARREDHTTSHTSLTLLSLAHWLFLVLTVFLGLNLSVTNRVILLRRHIRVFLPRIHIVCKCMLWLWYYLYLCILCDRYPLVWAKVMYHRISSCKWYGISWDGFWVGLITYLTLTSVQSCTLIPYRTVEHQYDKVVSIIILIIVYNQHLRLATGILYTGLDTAFSI
jgi:hypothetical protein